MSRIWKSEGSHWRFLSFCLPSWCKYDIGASRVRLGLCNHNNTCAHYSWCACCIIVAMFNQFDKGSAPLSIQISYAWAWRIYIPFLTTFIVHCCFQILAAPGVCTRCGRLIFVIEISANLIYLRHTLRISQAHGSQMSSYR